MSRKTIDMHFDGTTRVRVLKDSDTKEYIVKIDGYPEADYFTDDKEDALCTAKTQYEWAQKKALAAAYMR